MNTISFLSVASAAIALGMSSCSKNKPSSRESETPPINVAEAVVDSITLSKAYPGTLSSQNQADVVARVSGTLETQNYQNGDDVKKGQVLFTIEDTQYRDALQQAQAALANARSQYEYNSKHYAALQKALQSDAVAQIQVLEAKSALEQSEAAIKNAQAALETAQTNFGYCTIRAPFDGTMTKGALTPGAYVNGAGAPVTLGTIYDNSSFFANFYIDDNAYVRSLNSADSPSPIDFKHVPVVFADTLPHAYTGEMTYTDPSVDVGTGTILMRLEIKSPYNELKNGMYCSVKLPYKFIEKAVMVKDAAISTTQTTKYLYVVNDSNKVVYTPVETGELANDSMRIITKGLQGGERYVTEALLKVRPGMTVKPILTK